MSLQVWLPLNGTTKSQGVKAIQISNHDATVDSTGGILGSCYSFTGTSNQYLEFDRPMGAYYNDDFSWTIWVYPTTAKRGILLSEGGGASGSGSGEVAFELTATLQVRVYWNANPNILTTYTLPLNTWTHVAVTKTSNQILIYINGELNFTHNQPGGFSKRTSSKIARIGDDYRSGTTVDFAGKINDLRIYDHALSVSEVKEISRGLIRHYKFDDLSHGYIVDSSGYGFNSVTNNITAVNSDSARYSNCSVFNGSVYAEFPPLPMSSKSVSFWVKTTLSTPSAREIVFIDNGTHLSYGRNTSNNVYLSVVTKATGYSLKTNGYKFGEWNHIVIIKPDDTTRILYINGVQCTPFSTKDKWDHVLTTLNIGCRNNGTYNGFLSGSISDFRVYATELTSYDVMQLYEVRAKITATGEFHNYELVENTTAANTSVKNTGVAIATANGINENMLKTVPKLVSPTQYNAYQLEFTENLVAGQTYTLQLWNVDVSHTGKTEAQLGVWVYWGGGSTQLFSWSGTSNFTNGHADYLVKTFTITSSQASGSGSSNPWFNIYNSVSYASGTMNMKIGKWKLEKGSVPTAYVDDPTYSGYLGVNHGFIENDLLPINSVATKIHEGYIETKEFIED